MAMAPDRCSQITSEAVVSPRIGAGVGTVRVLPRGLVDGQRVLIADMLIFYQYN